MRSGLGNGLAVHLDGRPRVVLTRLRVLGPHDRQVRFGLALVEEREGKLGEDFEVVLNRTHQPPCEPLDGP